MKSNDHLALFGGKPAVTVTEPHHVWPPEPTQAELEEIANQRIKDIGIRGCVGPIKEFEDSFLKFLENQVSYSVSFNSGTSALLACYLALGIKKDDEVIGPALTYHAALSPLFILDAKPILVDVDKNTRCIDADKIEQAITPQTKAITVVHQWGHPADMDRILRIAKNHNLYVIEDCSHAHGSRYKGRLCGTIGDVAAFSLQTNKAIFAGEGGIFVTRNSKFHDRAVALGHYRDRCGSSVVDDDIKQYAATGFGLKLRMSPFNAIVAKHSLMHFPEIKEGRHRCLEYFNECLMDIPFIEQHYVSRDVDMGAWYGFKPVFLSEKLKGLDRETFVNACRAEGLDIGGPSGPPLSHHKLYQNVNNIIYNEQQSDTNWVYHLPVAEMLHQAALSLPTFDQWPNAKTTIEQYCAAFSKIEHHVDELLNIDKKKGAGHAYKAAS